PTLGYNPNATPLPVEPSSLPLAPGTKAVASTPGGPTVISSMDETAFGVYEFRTATGQMHMSHGLDRFMYQTPGAYYASHAEVKALFLNPGAASVTVSKPPCIGCVDAFRSAAALQGRTIPLHAATSQGPGTWTFVPNGNGSASVYVSPFISIGF